MDTLLTSLLEVVGIAVLLIGGVAIRHLADWLKLSADSEVRAYLLAGLHRAVDYGLEEARNRARLAGGLTSATQTRMAVELAADYAKARFPDALDRFGVTAHGLDEMIRARLPPSAG